MTCMAATVWSGVIGPGIAAATPLFSLMIPANSIAVTLSPAVSVSSATMKGPLRPGPNPSLMRS